MSTASTLKVPTTRPLRNAVLSHAALKAQVLDSELGHSIMGIKSINRDSFQWSKQVTLIKTGARRLERSFLCTHRKLISTMLTSFPLTLHHREKHSCTALGLVNHIGHELCNT